jgi:hypothetical protein
MVGLNLTLFLLTCLLIPSFSLVHKWNSLLKLGWLSIWPCLSCHLILVVIYALVRILLILGILILVPRWCLSLEILLILAKIEHSTTPPIITFELCRLNSEWILHRRSHSSLLLLNFSLLRSFVQPLSWNRNKVGIRSLFLFERIRIIAEIDIWTWLVIGW